MGKKGLERSDLDLDNLVIKALPTHTHTHTHTHANRHRRAQTHLQHPFNIIACARIPSRHAQPHTARHMLSVVLSALSRCGRCSADLAGLPSSPGLRLRREECRFRTNGSAAGSHPVDGSGSQPRSRDPVWGCLLCIRGRRS